MGPSSQDCPLFAQYALLEKRMKGIVCQHVHAPFQDLLQLHFQAGEVKHAFLPPQLHEDIDVACIVAFVPCERAEDRGPGNIMFSLDAETGKVLWQRAEVALAGMGGRRCSSATGRET